MRLFDTHCHFDAKAPEEVAAILARAKAAGVERLVAVGGSREMNEGAVCAAQCAAQTEGSPVVLTAFGYDMDGVDLNGDGGIGDAALPTDDGRDALCRVRGGIGDAALPLYIGRGASPMRPQEVSQLSPNKPAAFGFAEPAGQAISQIAVTDFDGTRSHDSVSETPRRFVASSASMISRLRSSGISP